MGLTLNPLLPLSASIARQKKLVFLLYTNVLNQPKLAPMKVQWHWPRPSKRNYSWTPSGRTEREYAILFLVCVGCVV